jgi:hypothetical protein
MSTRSTDCRRWREAIRSSVFETVAGEQAARVQSHLAACPECRHYAEELKAATAGLRWLGSRDVEPRPGFRARWTRAVEEAARPSTFGETAGAFIAWWHGLLLRNLRPALGVASLWILALVFRFSAPDVAPSPHTTMARSPVEIYQVLGGREQLMAGLPGRQFPVLGTPQKPHLSQPRSEGLPAKPAAYRDPQPGVCATVCEFLPHPIAHPNLSTLASV